jgi:hypothetical protein
MEGQLYVRMAPIEDTGPSGHNTGLTTRGYRVEQENGWSPCDPEAWHRSPEAAAKCFHAGGCREASA